MKEIYENKENKYKNILDSIRIYNCLFAMTMYKNTYAMDNAKKNHFTYIIQG